jgi:predicted transglutaminase-like cysteine proteinase
MLGRARAEFADTAVACHGNRLDCAMQKWSQLVDRLAPLPLREKVVRASAALNAVSYVPSTRNWSRATYWETPLEFLAYGGQCQDYAVAKYMLLRQAGVPADQMRIVVLRATSLDEDHAVLVVDVDGEALMLDNKQTGVVPVHSETSYRPYYSINELGWWQQVADTPIETAASEARTSSRNALAGRFDADFATGPLRRVARLIDSILLPFAEPSS